jgi:O-antigen/teichoic acid export membrane protein
MIGTLVAGFISVAGNALLVPTYGIPGSLVASLTTHLVVATLYAIWAFDCVRSWLLDRRTVFGTLILGTLAVVTLAGGGRFTMPVDITVSVIIVIVGLITMFPKSAKLDRMTAQVSNGVPPGVR